MEKFWKTAGFAGGGGIFKAFLYVLQKFWTFLKISLDTFRRYELFHNTLKIFRNVRFNQSISEILRFISNYWEKFVLNQVVFGAI